MENQEVICGRLNSRTWIIVTHRVMWEVILPQNPTPIRWSVTNISDSMRSTSVPGRFHLFCYFEDALQRHLCANMALPLKGRTKPSICFRKRRQNIVAISFLNQAKGSPSVLSRALSWRFIGFIRGIVSRRNHFRYGVTNVSSKSSSMRAEWVHLPGRSCVWRYVRNRFV